jgi:hypothetical protein
MQEQIACEITFRQLLHHMLSTWSSLADAHEPYWSSQNG